MVRADCLCLLWDEAVLGASVAVELTDAGEAAVFFEERVRATRFWIEVGVALNMTRALKEMERLFDKIIMLVLGARPTIPLGQPNGEAILVCDAFDKCFEMFRISAAVVVDGDEVDTEFFFFGSLHEFSQPIKSSLVRGGGGRAERDVFLFGDFDEFRPQFKGLINCQVALLFPVGFVEAEQVGDFIVCSDFGECA